MVNICLNAARKLPRGRPKSKNYRYKNEETVKLLEKLRKMRSQINSTRNKKLKAKKRKERSKILNKIKELINKEKEKVIEKEEINIASKKLTNGKSPGIDNMYVEYIVYAPETTHQIIADILRKSV